MAASLTNFFHTHPTSIATSVPEPCDVDSDRSNLSKLPYNELSGDANSMSTARSGGSGSSPNLAVLRGVVLAAIHLSSDCRVARNRTAHRPSSSSSGKSSCSVRPSRSRRSSDRCSTRQARCSPAFSVSSVPGGMDYPSSAVSPGSSAVVLSWLSSTYPCDGREPQPRRDGNPDGVCCLGGSR